MSVLQKIFIVLLLFQTALILLLSVNFCRLDDSISLCSFVRRFPSSLQTQNGCTFVIQGRTNHRVRSLDTDIEKFGSDAVGVKGLGSFDCVSAINGSETKGDREFTNSTQATTASFKPSQATPECLKAKFLSDSDIIRLTFNCENFRRTHGYERVRVTEEELSFPLAFNILLYKDVGQLHFLLRAIYRPHNSYCLHVDLKADRTVYKATSGLASCFHNVFLASRREDVVYASFARLQADLNCMKDHLARDFVDDGPQSDRVQAAQVHNHEPDFDTGPTELSQEYGFSGTHLKRPGSNGGVGRARVKEQNIGVGLFEKVSEQLNFDSRGNRFNSDSVKAQANEASEISFHRPSVPWKYLINLPSQEFPLKTNLELVRIIKSYNGSNNIETSPKLNKQSQNRFIFRHIVTRVDQWTSRQVVTSTEEKHEPPPFNLTIAKGSAYGVFSRTFVQFALRDNRTQALLDWFRWTYSPDEHFWATLQYNEQLQAPGAHRGPDGKLKTFPLPAWVNWNPEGKLYCLSGKYVRDICILGVKYLPHLVQKRELFANKFYTSFQPETLHCLDVWLVNKSRGSFFP